MTERLLNVWLHGELCGELEKLRSGGLRFRFSANFLRRYGVGTPSLSLSTPNTNKRIDGPKLQRFIDNLLPENPLRSQLERKYKLSPGDSFGLLHEIGLDCAGAIQFTSHHLAHQTGTYRKLRTTELNRLVEETPTLDTPSELPLTASLGGVQPKLLLWRDGSGWSWPLSGAPSNTIIKPDPQTNILVTNLIWYEHWALKLAGKAGLPSAKTTIERFGEREAIVIERFDRVDNLRVHQEDFNQILGLSVNDKYEPSNASGATRLSQVTALASEFAVPSFRADLLRQITFNAIVGNGDAHSKNYSIVLAPGGGISLSPLYDVAPVFFINSRYSSLGQVVADQSSLRHVTAEHLIREASAWGLPEAQAQDIVQKIAVSVAEKVSHLPITLPPDAEKNDLELSERVRKAIRNRAIKFS